MGIKCKILLNFVDIQKEIEIENKCAFVSYHAD
jgi:hypothetical protein